MKNVYVELESNKEIGWIEGRNGVSKAYALVLRCNDYDKRVHIESRNSRGEVTRGQIAVDLDHWLETTIKFLSELGYDVKKR